MLDAADVIELALAAFRVIPPLKMEMLAASLDQAAAATGDQSNYAVRTDLRRLAAASRGFMERVHSER